MLYGVKNKRSREYNSSRDFFFLYQDIYSDIIVLCGGFFYTLKKTPAGRLLQRENNVMKKWFIAFLLR